MIVPVLSSSKNIAAEMCQFTRICNDKFERIDFGPEFCLSEKVEKSRRRGVSSLIRRLDPARDNRREYSPSFGDIIATERSETISSHLKRWPLQNFLEISTCLSTAL